MADFTYDLFLSYSSKDSWVRQWLLPHLEAAGLKLCIDYRDFEIGQPALVNMENAALQSRRTAFVFSPNWVASEWTNFEALLVQSSDPVGIRGRLLPIMLENCELPPRLALFTWADFRDPQNHTNELLRLLKQLGSSISAQAISESPAKQTMPLHNLPHVSIGKRFQGRETELAGLRSTLLETGVEAVTQTRVVNGLGGIGKSRLALEYAWSFGASYETICFITADTPDEIQTNLANCNRLPDLPDLRAEGEAHRFEVVRSWFATHDGWLLILDNVDQIEALQAVLGLLPDLQRGHVLITSRLTSWPRTMVNQALDFLDEATACRFLLEETEHNRKHEHGEPEVALQLAKQLDGLPLALEQACAHINHEGLSLSEYQREWQQHLSEVLHWHKDPSSSYPNSVAATWLHSIQRVSVTARTLLRLAGLMAPEPLQVAVFEGEAVVAQAVTAMAEELSLEATPQKVVAALAELASYSLITREAGTIKLHRLVQEVLRGRIPEAARPSWVLWALRLIHAFAPGDTENDPNSWPVWQSLRPHVTRLFGEAQTLAIAEPTDELIRNLTMYLRAQALYGEARQLLEAMLALWQTAGVNEAGLGVTRTCLALVLKDLGALVEARDLFRLNLASYQDIYEEGHAEIAVTQSNLAMVLKDLVELEEARELLRAALASDQKSYPPGHPTIARCQSNLAGVLQDLVELEEARELLRAALASDQKSYPPGHPSIATYQFNLGRVLLEMGEPEEARLLFKQAHEAFLALFGSDHPHTKIAASWLKA